MQNFNNTLIIVGYSGHSFGVIESWLRSGGNIEGYIEYHPKEINPFNISYLGNDNFLFEKNRNKPIHLGFGNLKMRQIWLEKNTKDKSLNFQTVISKEASLSPYIKSIGVGTYVSRNASIQPLVEIGKNCILNTSCSIDHEVIIGDNCHIGPGAVVAGNVHISNNVFIGANSTIKEGIVIEENSIIGAGSVVTKNVLKHDVVVGNPARNIKK